MTSHFLAAIQQVDGGAAIDVADDQLAEILAAVRATGKKGKLTVEIEVAPNGERGFEVTTRVKARAPEVDFGKAFFYADANGHLTRSVPREESAQLLSMTE